MAKPFEVYKKPHDYVNDFHKEWSPISKQYEKRTPEYFDEVRKFKKYWSERWEATEKKSNLIIYGFEEKPKRSRHERDRSDLYLKIVKRNPKYKNWQNFGFALISTTLIMQIVALFNGFFHFLPGTQHEFISRAFTLISYISLGIYWFPSVFSGIKSMKYYPKKIKGGYKRTRKDSKWLNAYFASCMNLINTKLYVDTFLDSELEIEKEIKLITDYNELVQKSNLQADKLKEHQELLKSAKKIAEAYKEVVEQRDKLLEENTMLLRQKAYEGDFDD